MKLKIHFTTLTNTHTDRQRDRSREIEWAGGHERTKAGNVTRLRKGKDMCACWTPVFGIQFLRRHLNRHKARKFILQRTEQGHPCRGATLLRSHLNN